MQKVIFITKIIGVRYGLWENGKRVKWFNKEEVEKIERGYMKSMFKGQSFAPPAHFKYAVAN